MLKFILPALGFLIVNTAPARASDVLTSQKIENFRHSLEVMRDHLTADLARVHAEVTSMNEGDSQVVVDEMGPPLVSALSGALDETDVAQKILDVTVLSLGGLATNEDTADILQRIKAVK